MATTRPWSAQLRQTVEDEPRMLAEKLVAALQPEVFEAFDASVAGPGFINFKMKPAALTAGSWSTDR